MRNLLLPLLFVLCLLCAAPAAADLGSHFGTNPRSMALGGAYAAVADDVAAVYYNPAGLVQLKGVTVAAGVLAGLPVLSEDGARLDMQRETSWSLNLGVPVGGRLSDLLGFGLSLNIPFGKLFRARFYRKQDPVFVLYDANVDLFHLQIGGGLRVPWRPLSFLSLGVSMHVLASAFANVGFYAPFQRGGPQGGADPDARLEAHLDMEVPTEAFITAGALARLGEHVRVGVTYRSARYLKIDLPLSLNTRLALAGGTHIKLPVDAFARLRAKYWPRQVTFGLSYRSERLLLALDLGWVDYSTYEVPYARVDLDVQRLAADPGVQLFMGSDAVLLDPVKPRVTFKDALVPRLGVEYRALSWLLLRGGYYFERSPLAATDMPLFDTDKHSFSLGARGAFLRPFDLVSGVVNIDLSLQEVVYIGRSILASDVGGHVFAAFAGLELVLL